jgi:hypothetical protein
MIRYLHPRIGIFAITTDVYGEDGWVFENEAILIIGEVEIGYIYRFRETSIPYWDEYGEYEAFFTSPDWIHRTRFRGWKTTQAALF